MYASFRVSHLNSNKNENFLFFDLIRMAVDQKFKEFGECFMVYFNRLLPFIVFVQFSDTSAAYCCR